MSTKLYLPTAIAALALSGFALADTLPSAGTGADINANATGGVSLPALDKDADGKISKTEAGSNPELAKQFDKLDANKDGNLDQAEFAKFEAKGAAKGKASSKSGKGASTTTDDSMSPDSSTTTKPAPKQ